MTDRRRLHSNGRVAAAYLASMVVAERYVEPEAKCLAAVIADLCAEPKGPRDRQLLRGEVFNFLDLQDGWVFGYAEKDGYTGWLEAASFIPHPNHPTTHRVASSRSYAKSTPGLKAMGRTVSLPHGAKLCVLDESDGWSKVAWGRGTIPNDLYVPSKHLVPSLVLDTDPIEVAELYLGAPYLWGGNSVFGIDCSGLVQAGCLACGIPCPGDSDMQEAELGEPLAEGEPLQRGDLLFWRGHVAWVSDPDTLLHANAHHMAVAYEPIADTIARIKAQGDGPVTSRKRLKGLS